MPINNIEELIYAVALGLSGGQSELSSSPPEAGHDPAPICTMQLHHAEPGDTNTIDALKSRLGDRISVDTKNGVSGITFIMPGQVYAEPATHVDTIFAAKTEGYDTLGRPGILADINGIQWPKTAEYTSFNPVTCEQISKALNDLPLYTSNDQLPWGRTTSEFAEQIWNIPGLSSDFNSLAQSPNIKIIPEAAATPTKPEITIQPYSPGR